MMGQLIIQKNWLRSFNGKLNIKYFFKKIMVFHRQYLKHTVMQQGKFVIEMDSDDLFAEDGLDYILQSLKKI